MRRTTGRKSLVQSKNSWRTTMSDISAEVTAKNTTDRIIELLASGKSYRKMAEVLDAEGIATLTHSGVRQHVHKMLDSPELKRKFEAEMLVQHHLKRAWLVEVAEDRLTALDKIVKSLETQANEIEGGENHRTIVTLKLVSETLDKWWKNLSQIHNTIQKDTVSLNLTQVNIGQVNAVNGGLLSIIQDMMRHIPDEYQQQMFDRLAELEKPIDVEATEL